MRIRGKVFGNQNLKNESSGSKGVKSGHKKPKDELQTKIDFVYGKVPVTELLKSERLIDKILISVKESKGSVSKIIAMAKEKHVLVKNVSSDKLDKICNGFNHQGVIAFVATYKYSEVNDMFELAVKRQEKPFIVILDGIEDPHNMGAIIRTVEAAGAHGVIIPQRRNVGVTPVVSKVSAGAINHIPIARVANLINVIKDLKDKGLWIYCLESGGSCWYECDYRGPMAVVVGSEGKGVSRLVKENSDFLISLPMMGKVNSLNASVAAGIFMYEVIKQRYMGGYGKQEF